MPRVTGGMSGETGGMARGIGKSLGNDDAMIRARGAVLRNQSELNKRKLEKQNQDIVKQINKLRRGI
jgi:hypothetical protein